MIRIWLGMALLAGSWLLGLSYYLPASPIAWIVVVVAGAALLGRQESGVRSQETGDRRRETRRRKAGDAAGVDPVAAGRVVLSVAVSGRAAAAGVGIGDLGLLPNSASLAGIGFHARP